MSAQVSLTYRTNRDLFSNHYLDDHLPDTEEWNDVSEKELQDAYDRIQSLWEREQDTAPQRNESQLEEKFIRPMFRELGIPFEVEESVDRGQRRPDYGFFESEDAARNAFQRREEGDDFYENAVAVADAKRWGRALDTRGERERDFENPSYQIHVYLQETPAQWAVLTNGKKWRLYYGPTSHRLDSYYEIDLPTVLEQGDLEEFKYFYLFFRQEAFLPDASGDSFLDDVYDQSNIFAQELGEDLQDNIYEAIKVLSEGFLQYPDNDLGAEALEDADLLPDTRSSFEEARLDLVHDASLIYLYRLIFVLYAESEGRDLLDTDNEIYHESYSLNSLKQDVADELDSADPAYHDWQDDLWSRLDELFTLIDQGSESKGIPKDDLYIPAYNGGLFRTDPEEDDSREARFLARYEAGDEHLAEVIDLLTRSENGNGGGKIFVDYSSLDIRHLGSIYEGLLEYELNVAGEPLTLEDGEYVSADVGDDVAVEAGDVYLTTDSGERKATGSYYTPEYVVEYIVDNTLGPLVDDIYQDLLASDPWGQEGGGAFAEDFAERVFELKILDPAMGSGHFLTSAVDYLAREIINAQERQAEQQGVESIDQSHDINWARRQVAQRCIYGVDLNPLAVELAKVSLWLRTLAAEQPLAFLDHHLKTGNSLVGSDIEDVLDNGESATEDGQLTLQQSFARTRQQALEHVMDRFQDLLSIDNESLEDIKEMEAAFEEVRDDPLYQHLLAMANVHTAEEFGLDVPSNAYERMAEALRDDSWDDIEGQDWFESAQAMAEEEAFFHWELEFPVAFYGDNGTRKANPGFNAVISNPPYIRIQNLRQEQTAVADYLIESNRFTTTEARFDIYAPFVEQGVHLAQKGQLSYILPNKFFKSDGGEGLREYFSDLERITEVVDFGNYQVFSGAVTYTCILSLGHDTSTFDYVPAYDGVGNAQEIEQLESVSINNNEIGSDPWVLAGPRENEVLEKVSRSGNTVGDISEYVSQGLVTGDNEVLFVELLGIGEEYTTVRSKVNGETYRLETEIVHPVIDGDDVARYDPPTTEIAVIYPYQSNSGGLEIIPETTLQKKYPKSYDYLSEFRDRLSSRGSESMEYQTWYALWRPREKRLWEQPKLLHPRIVSQSEFTLDDDGGLYLHDSGYAIVPEENTRKFRHYLLGLLNSSTAWFYLYMTSPVIENDFRQPLANYLNPIPLPETATELEQEEFKESSNSYVESYVQHGEEPPQEKGGDLLAHLARELLNYYERQAEYNLDVLDYLGNYAEGPSLPDIGLFQPSGTNILDATTENYEKLRIGNAKTERDGRRVTVYATARYKPENEEEYETDQWGYTETGYEEAFSLTDLSEEEAALVEAFVPVTVEKADGFAGFRDNATKTNSLIDRLKAITLPDPDDVADDLRRYLEVKERAKELDEKIEKTEQLIDEIVYDLYDLTDEEIEIVEESVADD